jgi:hypothetical protein
VMIEIFMQRMKPDRAPSENTLRRRLINWQPLRIVFH